jgi:hypothetical protein
MRAIRREASKLDGLEALYGMGSYFRGESFHDVDFVAVVAHEPLILVDMGSVIRRCLQSFRTKLLADVDVTVLTSLEFDQNPLRDIAILVPLFFRKGRSQI